MNFSRYEISLTLRIVFLFVSLTVAAFCLVNGKATLLIFLGILLIFQTINLIQFLNKTNRELSQFIESVQYRDFSVQFSEKNAPISVRTLRKAFNQINSTFKQLSSEKEEQHQYLQKILEIVDTGILSYQDNTGEVGWMNESLKRMLNLPYLRSVYSIEKRDESLYQAIQALNSGENQLVIINGKKVLLAKTTFLNDNIKTQLLAFQNVNEAIEDTEAKAYQKLLRVMTHEIMNSVAPIASLADTLQTRLRQDDSHVREDVELGIATIKNRSENLLKFSDTYRSLAKISITSFSKFYVRDLFEDIEILLESQFEQKGIEFEVIIKDFEIEIEGDRILVEQVVINLIINAMDAVKELENPLVQLIVRVGNDHKAIIEVKDNGVGMSAELMEKIFVPFFTSKKNGSGIGLSLSKQIMALHRGSVSVQSTENQGSSFRLEF
jgi:two-component system, NtrC family, nitrogen regulation sensor histidine kinase NtrY